MSMAATAATACSVLFCSLFYFILQCKSNRLRQWFDWLVWVELGEGDSCATLLDVEYFKWIHGKLEGTKHWDSLGQCPLKAVTVRLSRGVRACTCPAAASCDGGGAQWGQLGPFGNGRHCGRLPPSLPAANHLNCLAAAAAVICASGWLKMFDSLSLSFFLALFCTLFFPTALPACLCVFSIISYCALYSLFLSIQCRK